MSNKINVIVCGSTFGQLYLKALKDRKELFNIIGLLGTGSERSKKCADEYDIPLYTDMNKVPEDIDLACIAVRTSVFGGKGTEIALDFLEKGVNVIQEHPSHPKDMEQCYRIARRKNVIYHIGNLYPYLDDVQKFIRCANYLNSHDELIHIDTMFAGQVSYPLIKILQLSMPSIQKWKLEGCETTEGIFQILHGKLGNIPVCMHINNELVVEDPNNYMHVLHRITFFYNGGRLTLENTFGPLTWHPRMFIPISTALKGTLDMKFPDNVCQNTGYTLSKKNEDKTFEQVLTCVWPMAIQRDLELVYNQIVEKRIDINIIQKELLCARQWNQITKELGYSKLVPKKQIELISISELIQTCKGGEEW